MKLLAVVAGLAGALTGMITTRGLMAIAASGMKLPPTSLEDALGVMALALCALGVAGAVLAMSGALSGFMLLAAGAGFWLFLPDYALPAAPLFFVSAVAAIMTR